MRRTRRSVKKAAIVENSSDSEEDIPLKKLRETPKKNSVKTATPQKSKTNESSSSESDIESYLQPVDKIDLSSSFFKTQKKTENEFDKIEKTMFSGVTRLSDSSESDLEEVEDKPPSQDASLKEEKNANVGPSETKLNFHQLEEYTRKIDEAKKQVEKYNAKQTAEEGNMDISNLLAMGESKQITLDNIKEEDLHPSDFESSEDDWEEVKVKEQQEKASAVPKTGIEITLDAMPDHCKKKKGVDLLAAMKRRLNRIRKENQVYIHKVHLLCWIAHGNYLNSVINNTQLLGLALSLLPSDKCYPADRTDLSYLEQIVQWYKKTMKLAEKSSPKELELLNSLQLQINRKEAFDKKMYVLIFIAILRSLGIQCRLVMSLQVEPLRPHASELHSLAKESNVKIKNGKDKVGSKTTKVNEKPASTKGESSSNSLDKGKKKKTETTKVTKVVSSDKEKNTRKEIVNSTKKDRDSKELKSQDKDKKDALKSTNVQKVSSTNEEKNQNKKKSSAKDKNSNENQSSTKVKKSNEKLAKSSGTSTTKSLDHKEQSAANGRTRSKSSADKKETANLAVDTKKDSLSVKNVGTKRSKSGSIRTSNASEAVKPRSKSSSEGNKDRPGLRNRTKKASETVPQLDGLNDSSDEHELSDASQLDGANDEKMSKKPNLKKLKVTEEKASTTKKNLRRLKSTNNNNTSEDEFVPSPKKSVSSSKKPNLSKLKNSPPKRQLDVRNDIVNLIKGRITEQKHIDRGKMTNKRKMKYEEDESDSDYVPEAIKKKHHDSDSDLDYFVPKPKVKKRVSVKRERPGAKIISDDSDLDESGKKKKKGVNVWVEVFLEAEEKWITADLIKGQVHCINELYNRATHPVSYIVAWNNNNTLKDVTRRYCKNFNTITRKLRVDIKWWEESIRPFLDKPTARDKEEDDDLNRQQLDQPMPKAISEYKNHPLYALRRHLLKFEDIYPPDIVPLGYVRGEPVYPRNCVYVCKSRDIWLKEAKVVKPGEKPYKIVKARPKYDRLSNKMITDQLLEIFGPWQTMDYDPPTAENGVVPRNAFGNVELFKACMLPKGTVHLKLAGLNKVCKKLNVDCASAIVGFDFHGGWSHPTYDGFVICKEFEDQVVAAWELDQEEQEKRENEKVDKRVYGNWRKLIKGLLIRERLKAKYDFGGENSKEGNDKKKGKGSRLVVQKRKIVSDSESD